MTFYRPAKSIPFLIQVVVQVACYLIQITAIRKPVTYNFELPDSGNSGAIAYKIHRAACPYLFHNSKAFLNVKT